MPAFPCSRLLLVAIAVASFAPPPRVRAEAEPAAAGPSAPEILRKLGLEPRAEELAKGGADADPGRNISQPNILEIRSALSAAAMVANEKSLNLTADWDGREDIVADRKRLLDSVSASAAGNFFTRTGISAHTVANGFNENIYYSGDAQGNFILGVDSDLDGVVDSQAVVDIEQLISADVSGGVTLLNPSNGDFTSPDLVITGIAVNPVADLGDFGHCGLVGEIVYVSVFDAVGGATNAQNQPFRSRIFAFALEDPSSGAPNIDSALQILRNPLANLGGVAVDDDGSLYFCLADLNQLQGGAIYKVQEGPRNICGDPARINRAIASIPSGLTGGINLNTAQGTGSFPIFTSNGYRLSNLSGPSAVFGNVVAIAAGPPNTLYAAVARSFNPEDDAATQATEGLFTNPASVGPTPSMVIGFADNAGRFELVNGPIPGDAGPIPYPDGLADVAVEGELYAPGVNNYRAFVLGNGPDVRDGARPGVFGTAENTLKLDMSIDFSLYAGLSYDHDRKLYVISGGTPAGVGADPSRLVSEVLCFPDSAPADRRADYIDFRGNNLPNPPASGGNVGDGDSDRFDHVYLVAPVNPVTLSRTGLAGLSHGHLRCLQRLAPNPISVGLDQGTYAGENVTTDDETIGPIFFEGFDPGHQTAGGDDQNTPFRGDDNDGAGNSLMVGPLMGGFEFNFGGPVGIAGAIWNSFFFNANGSVSFGAGDATTLPTEAAFRSGPPKIAAAWTDIHPGQRPGVPASFALVSMGFASVNHFKIRYINVPRFDADAVNSRNTFSISLFDDGVSIDENANQPLNPANPIGNNAVPFDLQEGPTDLRFVREPNTQVLIGMNARPPGSGLFAFEYGSNDLIGASLRPVLAGYSIGGLDPNVPPGSCEVNLSEAGIASDSGAFGAIQGQLVMTTPHVIGDGTDATIFEFFSSATPPNGTDPAIPEFDLRAEGNFSGQGSPLTQPDPNRGYLAFSGTAAAPPSNPLFATVVPSMLETAPGTSGFINALCGAEVTLVGTGIYPDAVTQVCPGDAEERAGKTLSTEIVMTLDTDNDGLADFTQPLANVIPLGPNALRATIPPAAGLPGTPFPLSLAGGVLTFAATTTFSAGDNNVFGPFVRNAAAVTAAGTRAPVVLGVSGGSTDCSGPQTLTITGASFNFNGNPNVTGAKLVALDNPANTITGTDVMISDDTTASATFDFSQGSPASTWLVHLTGPGGTSRNIPPPSAVCQTGNELGDLVTAECENPNRAQDWELYR